MIEISVIIPVFNNENTISFLVEDLIRYLKNRFTFEIILIEDGSADNSWNLITTLIQKNAAKERITAIKHKTNFGQENAKLAGLRMAKGNFIVFMDADYQHKPEDIGLLYESCKNGYDICYANFTNVKKTRLKTVGSIFYNLLAVIFLKKPKGIYLSSFNMLNKKTADIISAYSTPILNLDSIALINTQNVTQVNTTQLKSLKKESGYKFKKSIQLLFHLLPGFSVKPTRFILFSGIVIFTVGMLMLGIKTINISSDIQFISFFQIVSVTMSGLILLSIGIIGEYIGKIYIILHGTKQYEIDSIITSNYND